VSDLPIHVDCHHGQESERRQLLALHELRRSLEQRPSEFQAPQLQLAVVPPVRLTCSWQNPTVKRITPEAHHSSGQKSDRPVIG